MTRKDYIALATVLAQVRRAYAPHWDPNLFRACTDHVLAIADMLAADNPRFDRARFLDQSGVPDTSRAHAERVRYTSHGRVWWINEGHPDTDKDFCVCRTIDDGGNLGHTAIIARKELTKVSQ